MRDLVYTARAGARRRCRQQLTQLFNAMADLANPRLIKLKGLLFLAAGSLSALLLVMDAPSLRTTLLLVIAIWSFCRAYYFAFYVIEHYVDPSFHFSGLGSFIRYLVQRHSK